MKVLCVDLGTGRDNDPWLTLNREYVVLSILMTNKGPAKLRVIADDNRTPILAEATLFASIPQSLPRTWVSIIREGGVLELGPPRWLELGFWERYFDGDAEAVAEFRDEVQLMTDASRLPR
jgi:hypothetical protein